MDSTLATLLVKHDHVVLAHIGDSRIYRMRDGVLEQFTVDHSMYEEMRRHHGRDVPPKAETAYGHMTTRALGMDGDPRADVRREALRCGDTFLLCTDGLTEAMTDDDLALALCSADLDGTCRGLVEDAYERGGRDNITAVPARAVR